ncbi:hypothetical protein B0O80DRAFT_40073 [Mortierella sp. GBAus27b]|nr:hypothetical protein B0O80DRAFT_40073 [Mortierella sp. GBAus27b]
MQAFDQSDSELDLPSGEDDLPEEGSDEMESGSEQDDGSEDDDSEDEDDLGSEDNDESEDPDSDDDSEDSDEDSDSNSSGDSGSDDDNRELKELQKNLAQIPFDKLSEIQQKVGMKVFHQTLRGSEKKKATPKGSQQKGRSYDDDGSEDDEEDSDDESDDEDTQSPKSKLDKLRGAMNKEKRERKVIERRTDKNRPMEVGSKKPVGRFRQVVEVSSSKRRDPRFDSLSGKLHTDLFEKSYSFLKDYRADEMSKLREQVKKEKDVTTKEKLERQLSRMVDRQSTEAAQKRRQDIKRDHKRKERELIAQGKNPFFLKKADQKRLELIDKFQHLKDNPKALNRAMEKRRKRNAAKEKTKVLGVKRRRTE